MGTIGCSGNGIPAGGHDTECIVVGSGISAEILAELVSNRNGIASGGEGGRRAPVALVGDTADGLDGDVVLSLGLEAVDGGGVANDVEVGVGNRIGYSVAHLEVGLGAVGIPGDGGTGGSDTYNRDVIRIGAGSGGQHMQRVVMSHRP